MFNKLSLKFKIIAGGLLPLILVAFINILGLFNFNKMQDSLNWVNHTNEVIRTAEKIEKIAVDMETGERGFILTGEKSFLEPYTIGYRAYEKVLKELLLLVNDNPNQIKVLKEANDLINNWLTNIAEKYIKKRQQLDEAKSKSAAKIMGELVAKGEGKIYFDKFRTSMKSFKDEELRLLKLRNESSEYLTASTNNMIIVSTLSAIIMALFISAFLVKSIIQPINRLKECASKISQGDLDIVVEDSDRGDEIGYLAKSFKQMQEYITEFANIAHKIGNGDLSVEITKRSDKDILGIAIDNMSKNLTLIISELIEGINVLSSSISQIQATTAELASSAAETSSAVVETSTTAEEVKQTSQLNYDKAIHVVENTKQAIKNSQTGNAMLDENMAVLKSIRDGMENIAQNIIALSEQSQTIGEIVTAVEDIANQSNILSVNASIEAVKAGEEGKGFSVVAQELKTLAEQSKEGTSRVQKILGDIQKATGSLVMTAEQGGKVVEQGFEQATKVKESFDLLNRSIEQAAQSSNQIALSSEQEKAGMKQIADAMKNIRDASLQNSDGISQVQSAVNSLSNLSHKLKTITDQYKIR